MTTTALPAAVQPAAPVAAGAPSTDGADRGGLLLFAAVATTILLGSLAFGPVLVPSADLDKPFTKLSSVDGTTP